MISTYKEDDVILLFKDISGVIEPLGTKEREAFIQSGVHYSEMLPLEPKPTEEYLNAYKNAMDTTSRKTALSVALVSEKIYREKGENITLVSLARGGISIGVLIKRYLKLVHNIDVNHYAISIIRGKGIDKNAMDYILDNHRPESIQFVDGWTGKGAIQRQLSEAMKDYKDVSSGIAVLSDPAHLAEKCGTHEDFLIPCSMLNSTVSGLISRTFYRKDIIGEKDFHGVAFYKGLENEDLTYHFIDVVCNHFKLINTNLDYLESELKENNIPKISAIDEVEGICKIFDITDINFVKPSIGEATRVLLRRVPWKILVHSLDDSELSYLYKLAKEKGVEVLEYPLINYKVCGIIQNLADS